MASETLPINMAQLAWAALAGVFIVTASYRAKFLTVSGAIAAFILAVFIFGFGGWSWTVPMLTFFIFSSILSKIGRKRKQQFKDTFEKSGIRDYQQVAANGGLGAVFVVGGLFFPQNIMYSLYLISLAVATADTWATEIGVMFSGHPRLITSFNRVEAGISGAVSFSGTLAALLGSMLIAYSGYIFTHSLTQMVLMTVAGLCGSFIDSLLGAILQAQYRCRICSKFTEKKIHCQTQSIHVAGLKWLNNDLVNLGSTILTICIFQLSIFLFL